MAHGSVGFDALARDLELAERDGWADLFRAASPAAAETAGLGTARLDGAMLTIVSKADVLALNRAIALGIDEPATETLIDEVITCFRHAEVPRFFVPLSPAARPADLIPRWLQAKGLDPYNCWMILHRELPGPALTFEGETRTEELRIERIGPESGNEFMDMSGEALDWPDPVRRCMAGVVGRPGWHHYVAHIGDRPVGTAALWVHGRSAWFTSASTRPEARGRGVQSALIRHRLREAHAMGCTRAHVETAEDKPDKPAPSYRNLTRLGFELAYARPNWIWRES